jgi:hypothetical protein
MARDAFVAELEKRIEAASDALLQETGLGHLYGQD